MKINFYSRQDIIGEKWIPFQLTSHTSQTEENVTITMTGDELTLKISCFPVRVANLKNKNNN